MNYSLIVLIGAAFNIYKKYGRILSNCISFINIHYEAPEYMRQVIYAKQTHNH